ncbi:uncharacterized protein [Ptychodera flava]|uniref:uncharacterized protein n=1 Tax=Ptychodera flava TaxID=63121 RepID=UPI003969CE1F
MESLVDECYPCSLCFNDSRGYSPPRIQECVEQGMPANMQCRPSRSGTLSVNGYADIVTGGVMTEETGVYSGGVGIQQVVLQSNLSLTSTNVSPKSNNHVSITLSVLTAAAVIVAIFAVVIRFGCKRNRHYRSLTSAPNHPG